MTAYYNENDPFAAQWLRNLVEAGHIAPGYVDERDICDVAPQDLAGFTQCHFFAGIGGWSLALRKAGWPDSRPVWTGSCPCQPFSAAGKGAGFDDERHLWPIFHWLIQQRRPAIVFGEQVSSKAAEPWLDLVQADLEALGYAFGCVAFPAAGIGAPHMRDRSYWLGHCIGAGLEGHAGHGDRAPGRTQQAGPVTTPGGAVRVADSEHDQQRPGGKPGREEEAGDEPGPESSGRGEAGGLEYADNRGRWQERELGGLPQISGGGQDEREPVAGASVCSRGSGPVNGEWRVADWLYCRDGKWRPVEPGTFPLVDGLPNRVGLLRGYGNAIVPAQAAEFIIAAKDYIAQEKAIEIVAGMNA